MVPGEARERKPKEENNEEHSDSKDTRVFLKAREIRGEPR